MPSFDSKAEPKVSVLRARQLLREKRYTDALQVCTDELARGTDDPDLRLVAANSLMAQGRHEGAKKEAQQVIRLDPSQTEAHRILADVACTRGDLDAARDHLQRILEIEPDDAQSRLLLETLFGPEAQHPAGALGEGRRLASFLDADAVLFGGSETPADEEDDHPGEDQAAEDHRGNDHRPAARRPEPSTRGMESAPLELSADDLEEEFEEVADDEGEDGAEDKEAAEGPGDAHVDLFSGESFPVTANITDDIQVTDSMMFEVPGPGAGPGLMIEPRRIGAPRGLRTLHDEQPPTPPHEEPPPARRPAAAAEDAWKPAMDAGSAPDKPYDGTLRLPALGDLPEEDEAPTMPLLRPSAPPAPQLRLDPMGAKPVSHEKVGEVHRPAPAASLPPPTRPTAPVDEIRRTVLGTGALPPASPRDRAGGGAPAPYPPPGPAPAPYPPQGPGPDFEDFAVEPASVPLALPEPKPIPRDVLDPIKARQQMTRELGSTAPAPMQREVPAPSSASAQADPNDLMSMFAGTTARADASVPRLSSGFGDETPFPAPTGAALTPDDIERQLLAAANAPPQDHVFRKERSHPFRWFLVAVLGLVLGGGGLSGYLWYRSYKYVQGELANVRKNVHRSNPDGYRQARAAAERILQRKRNDARASAAMAMCDAAMSIEFGDDQIKSARELLEQSKGSDSEWRTAAHAFLALIDDPARAEGYLQKGIEVYPESALLLYLRGRALAASGAPDKAAASFQSALKIAPRYFAAQIGLAVLLGQQTTGYNDAEQALAELIRVDPDNIQALIERARLHARYGKELEAAANDARRVTGELAAKAGRGQVGWAHLVLAQLARLGKDFPGMSAELDESGKNPHCCDAAFRYELAGEMMYLHRMADAQVHLREALALKPKQPEFLQRMARVLIELDDLREAATYLQAAPPRHIETRLLQGRLALARGQYGKATEALSSVLAEDKEALEAAIYLQLVQARRGKAAEAAAELQKLAAAHADQPEILLALGQVQRWSGELTKADATLKAAWKLTKLDPAIPTELGHVSVKLNDLPRAQKRFTTALRHRPDYRQARIGLAYLLLLTGNLTEAEQQLGAIAEGDRRKPDALALAARLSLAAGKVDAAKASIDEAEGAGASPALLTRLQGELALARKQGKTADELLRKAAKLAGGRDLELLLLLGRAEIMASKVDDAYETFHDVLREDKGSPEALLELGRIAIADAELGIAVQRLNEALERLKERQRPSSMKAAMHSALGHAYLKRRDTGRALTNLQDAIDLDPNAAEPQHLMGQTYEALDRPQRAIPYYAKAFELDPTLVEVLERMGKAYAKLGDAANAAKYYQAFLETRPPAAKARAIQLELQKLQQE